MTDDGIANFVLLTTVQHTGTHYVLSGINNKFSVSQWHCKPGVTRHFDSFDWIATTHRDPYRVAASWANRDELKGLNNDWFEQWRGWKEVMNYGYGVKLFTLKPQEHCFTFPEDKVESHPDVLGVHDMLDNEDYDAFHKIVPKELTDFAIECCEGLQ